MSGICGIANLDGRPVAAHEIERMATAAARRGPDGMTAWRSGPVWLAHQRLHTTPQSLAEVQPLVDPERHLVLAADARLDNRDELTAALAGELRSVLRLRASNEAVGSVLNGGEAIDYVNSNGYAPLKEDRPRAAASYYSLSDVSTQRPSANGVGAPVLSAGEATDAELILAAYRCWGAGCPQHLIGDFAFAIYDWERRRLFCARDAVGVRQLVYYMDERRFLFASDLAPLRCLLPEAALNPHLIQDWVDGRMQRYLTQTPYAAISRLPPSYSAMLVGDRLSLQRYWTFGAGPAPSYQREEEWVEAFADLFAGVLRAQLRSSHPAAILAGGGFDSAAVAVLTEREIAAGRVTTPTGVYAMVSPGIPDADESEYLHALLAVCPHLPFSEIDITDEWTLKVASRGTFQPVDLDMGVSAWHGEPRLFAAAIDDGRRVFLSGAYGDQVLVEDFYRMPASLREMPLSRWPGELPHFTRSGRIPAWQVAAYAVLAAGLPERLRLRLWDAAGRTPPPATQFSSREPERGEWDDPLPAPPLGRLAIHIYRQVHCGATAARLNSYDAWSVHQGIERRLPYLDRRLVEFMLHVPVELLARLGRSRHLLRQALAGLLPEAIRQRTSKTHFLYHLHRGLVDQEKDFILKLVQDPCLVRLGLVEAPAWHTAWRSHWENAAVPFQELLPLLSAEIWMRANVTC